jgi:hypothetical protein
MNFIVCTFTPKSGGEKFAIKNIEFVSFRVSRRPSDNGYIGSRAHEISTITIRRQKSLAEKGTAAMEEETIQLAAATQQNAYFSGEITIARADDKKNVIQTIRWEDGHIVDLQSQVYENSITETIEVCVPALTVDDSQFFRVQANP